MNHTKQVAYAIAGACFAAILSLDTNSRWWELHPYISVSLGASMPICILGAWMSQLDFKERKIWGITIHPHSPKAWKIAAWCGILIGLISLTAFLAAISFYIAFGFFIGSFLLSSFTDIFK